MIIPILWVEACKDTPKTSIETILSDFKNSYYQELLQKGDSEEIDYYKWLLARGINYTLVLYEWESVPHVTIWSSSRPFIHSGVPVWRTAIGPDSLFFHQVTESGIDSAKINLFGFLDLEYLEKNDYPIIDGEPYSMDYVFVNNKWVLDEKGWRNVGHWFEAERKDEKRKYAIRFDSLIGMVNNDSLKFHRNKLVFDLIQDNRDLFIDMIKSHKETCAPILIELQNPTCDSEVIDECILLIYHYDEEKRDSVQSLVLDALEEGLRISKCPRGVRVK